MNSCLYSFNHLLIVLPIFLLIYLLFFPFIHSFRACIYNVPEKHQVVAFSGPPDCSKVEAFSIPKECSPFVSAKPSHHVTLFAQVILFALMATGMTAAAGMR